MTRLYLSQLFTVLALPLPFPNAHIDLLRNFTLILKYFQTYCKSRNSLVLKWMQPLNSFNKEIILEFHEFSEVTDQVYDQT